MVTLYLVLRFVLPTASQSLGSSSLASLLCLDWVTAELSLRFTFDHPLSRLLGGNADLTVDLAEVEGLVIPEVHSIDSRKGEKWQEKKDCTR